MRISLTLCLNLMVTGLGLLVVSGSATPAASAGSLDSHLPLLEAVAAEDTAAFMGQLHPELRDLVDEPILMVWMRAFNKATGTCQYKATGSHLVSKISYTLDGKQTHGEIDVQYTRGVVRSSVTVQNDQVIAFKITSDQLSDGWFDGPDDARLYLNRGKTFLMGLLDGQYEKIEPMMHDALVKMAPASKLAEIDEIASGWVGEVTQFEIVSGDLNRDDDGVTLECRFLIHGTAGTARASTKFLFDGLKGYLVSFDYSPGSDVDASAATDETLASK